MGRAPIACSSRCLDKILRVPYKKGRAGLLSPSVRVQTTTAGTAWRQGLVAAAHTDPQSGSRER